MRQGCEWVESPSADFIFYYFIFEAELGHALFNHTVYVSCLTCLHLYLQAYMDKERAAPDAADDAIEDTEAIAKRKQECEVSVWFSEHIADTYAAPTCRPPCLLSFRCVPIL